MAQKEMGRSCTHKQNRIEFYSGLKQKVKSIWLENLNLLLFFHWTSTPFYLLQDVDHIGQNKKTLKRKPKTIYMEKQNQEKLSRK